MFNTRSFTTTISILTIFCPTRQLSALSHNMLLSDTNSNQCCMLLNVYNETSKLGGNYIQCRARWAIRWCKLRWLPRAPNCKPLCPHTASRPRRPTRWNRCKFGVRASWSSFLNTWAEMSALNCPEDRPDPLELWARAKCALSVCKTSFWLDYFTVLSYLNRSIAFSAIPYSAMVFCLKSAISTCRSTRPYWLMISRSMNCFPRPDRNLDVLERPEICGPALEAGRSTHFLFLVARGQRQWRLLFPDARFAGQHQKWQCGRRACPVRSRAGWYLWSKYIYFNFQVVSS